VILVAGGSGFIGSAVVRRLVAGGADVAVMTAHPSKSEGRIASMGARAIAGDVLDPPSLDRAVAGAEVVIQALTFPTFPVEKPRRRYTFDAFDHLGTEALARAAARAGARKFLYSSGVGADPRAERVWFRAKGEGEQAIRATGIDHAIVRPSWVYGPEDRALNKFVALHRWLPFVPVVGHGEQPLQPVFVEDVAEAFVRAAEPGGPSGTFEIGGPDVMSMNDVLRTMMDVRGRRKPLVHFPVWMPKLAGVFLQFMPKPFLSPAAVEFTIGEALADTGPFEEAFGQRLTPLREGLATYLAPSGRR
jgi:NADH dehydrogenase